uniref:PRELI/MSF1 domain-containing protein n=1 Tax=Acrobeloides nanus TaxID=290746 RepID=A0A914CD32_9BILA
MDERCRYFPAKDPTKTESIRELKLGVMGFNGAFTYTVEKVLAMAFKKSVHKTYMGFEEKLGQRFGLPPHHTLSEKVHDMTDRMREKKNVMKEKISRGLEKV